MYITLTLNYLAKSFSKRRKIATVTIEKHSIVQKFGCLYSTPDNAKPLLTTKLFKKFSLISFQHLIERSWYAVTETCLAFTVFRDDFSPRFVAQFTLLLFLKCFHWLAEDRIDYMERSPVLSWLFHVRAVLLLMFLGMVDAVLVHIAYNTTMQSGASVQLVFGFEVRTIFIPH